MKKVISSALLVLIFGFGMLAPSLNASEIGSSTRTLYTKDPKAYKSCDNVNHEDSSFHNGRLVYGCNTFMVDEFFSTYQRTGSNQYRGAVEKSNTAFTYGPWTSENYKSEAQTSFYVGTTMFGMDD